MLEALRKEKEALAKQKQAKQLKIEDAPRKVKVEKVSAIKNLFSAKPNSVTTKDLKESTKKINFNNWELPSLNLLKDRGGSIIYDENEIRRKEIEIQEKLLQFKIEVEML
jgi:hypothetical protein